MLAALGPPPAYSITQKLIVDEINAEVCSSIPFQFPGAGITALVVKVIVLSDFPFAIILPATTSILPVLNLTVVPGLIVRILPEGMNTESAVTIPDHVVSIVIAPEIFCAVSVNGRYAASIHRKRNERFIVIVLLKNVFEVRL